MDNPFPVAFYADYEYYAGFRFNFLLFPVNPTGNFHNFTRVRYFVKKVQYTSGSPEVLYTSVFYEHGFICGVHPVFQGDKQWRLDTY